MIWKPEDLLKTISSFGPRGLGSGSREVVPDIEFFENPLACLRPMRETGTGDFWFLHQESNDKTN